MNASVAGPFVEERVGDINERAGNKHTKKKDTALYCTRDHITAVVVAQVTGSSVTE